MTNEQVIKALGAFVIYKYLKSSLSDWRQWWKAPTTRSDRIVGIVIGAIGGCVIGIILRVVVGPLPAPLATFALWAVLGLFVGMTFGGIFPKPIGLLCAPFVKLLEGI